MTAGYGVGVTVAQHCQANAEKIREFLIEVFVEFFRIFNFLIIIRIEL